MNPKILERDVRGSGVTTISVLLPIRAVSEANARECWQAKHRRAKAQRETTRLMLVGLCRSIRGQKASVTLTRIGKRNLDGDNLQRALKAVRDGVADALYVDDGDKRLEWTYGQERGEYAVRVELT